MPHILEQMEEHVGFRLPCSVKTQGNPLQSDKVLMGIADVHICRKGGQIMQITNKALAHESLGPRICS